jgi:hypothetical protein
VREASLCDALPSAERAPALAAARSHWRAARVACGLHGVAGAAPKWWRLAAPRAPLARASEGARSAYLKV